MRTSLLKLFISFVLGSFACSLWAQDSSAGFEHRLTILFYNVENCFLPSDNPEKDDDDFTPSGSRHWTYSRLNTKLQHIAQVLMAADGGHAPSLVGLAEVESDSCLYRLTHNTVVWQWGYRYVVTDSRDRRGINVALMYQPDDYRLLGYESIRIEMPEGVRPTRDVLHAWGRVVSGDTLDVMVCHLPSRLGGARQSEGARLAAHQHLRMAIDSLSKVRKAPYIMVMGDMNDYPDTRSLRRDMRMGDGLNNLMEPLQKSLKKGKLPYGSHKYDGEWGFLDQIWVNDALMPNRGNPLSVGDPQPVCFSFMLAEDATHLGHRPLRSFYGYQYEGGYSDHLPVKAVFRVSY